jgi:DNA repair protein SbcD/Mre11
MKIIHVADSHLGRTSFNKLTSEGANLRESLIYENFLDGVQSIIDERPDVLVHAGDLFDTVKPKTKAYAVVLEALEWLHEAGISVIVIAGNHSMQKTLHTTSPFEVIARAADIHAAYSFKYQNVEIQDTIFHLIPNMLHAEDYHTAAKEIEIKPGYNNVLVTHGLADSIKDKRLSTVAEFELDSEVLSDKFDYIALGHYHGQVKVAPNAWYSGSQEHLTYGEIRDRKGALLVDPGRHSVDHFHLPRSPMTDLGIITCWDRSIDDIIEDIHGAIGLLDGVGDQMFQITLDFDSNPVKTIPTEALADIREQVLDLKVRIRSKETERAVIQQQDLHAINYVDEWSRFMGPMYPMNETMRAIIERRGAETLKAVMAEHPAGGSE